MDCIVHGVPKSQTWLSNFHFTSLPDKETVTHRLNHLLFLPFVLPNILSIFFCLLSAPGSWPVWSSFQLDIANERTQQGTRGMEQREVKFYFLLKCCLTLAMLLNIMSWSLCMWPCLHSFLLPSPRNQLFPSSDISSVTRMGVLTISHSFLTRYLHFNISPFMNFSSNCSTLSFECIMSFPLEACLM